MKINISDRAKSIILLVLLLTGAVVWGTSSVLLFIEDSFFWAVVSFVSYFYVFVLVFAIDFHTNSYKLKYVLDKKTFKKKLKVYESELLRFDRKERKRIVSNMKKEFYRQGTVSVTMYYELETPNKVWRETNASFNYGNALDKQKEGYMVCCLYSCCLGGGFYRFFEDLAFDMFSYEEYESIVKKSELFSDKLKKNLTKKEFKKIFNCFKKMDNKTEEDWKILQEFDESDSIHLYDYMEELFEITKKLAIEEYLFVKMRDGIVSGTKRLFISKDRMKRVYVRFDENLKAFKVGYQDFIFYDDECEIINSGGGWITAEESSIFESEKLALKEIENQIVDFDEIEI